MPPRDGGQRIRSAFDLTGGRQDVGAQAQRFAASIGDDAACAQCVRPSARVAIANDDKCTAILSPAFCLDSVHGEARDELPLQLQ